MIPLNPLHESAPMSRTLYLMSLLLCAATPAWAADTTATTQWRDIPERLEDLAHAGARVASSSAVIWPGGWPTLITYLQNEKKVYRCIDWYDAKGQPDHFQCYEAFYGGKE